jgi:hypothetical protein
MLTVDYYELSIQAVSEIRGLILTSERTRQFMKLFFTTFCKIRKSIPRFFTPQFLPKELFCVINYSIAVITFYLLRPLKLTNQNQTPIQSVQLFITFAT